MFNKFKNTALKKKTISECCGPKPFLQATLSESQEMVLVSLSIVRKLCVNHMHIFCAHP